MVSPHFALAHSSVAMLSRAQLAPRRSPTRKPLLLCRRVVGHGQRGPSVPPRWRPAHGTQSAISLWSLSARYAARLGPPSHARPRASAKQVLPFQRLSRRTSCGFQFRSVCAHNAPCKRIQTPSPLPVPPVSRHPRQRGVLPCRRLTLPSSGPAYGGPLKSNVRQQEAMCRYSIAIPTIRRSFVCPRASRSSS